MSLMQQIRAEIAAQGPMPFDRFMTLALYDPLEGFFGSGPLRSSKSGDFLTSPEISPWFGRMIARFLRQRLDGVPGPLRLVEAGAGSGSLLQPLLDEADGLFADVVAVEASPAARRALENAGHNTAADLADVAPTSFRGAVVANELLDNLPMAIAVRTEVGWNEHMVALGDDSLEFVEVPARQAVAEWAEAYGGPVQAGSIVEAQLSATAWITGVISRLDRGVVLAIDYGATTEELVPRRSQGTVRTYRAHHLGPDPLLEPGATDITADVNFTALLEMARRSGATARVFRQDEFLDDLGLRDELLRLRDRELDLARGDDALARLVIRSEIKDAETLLHPRGLGDFRVLVVDVR